MHCVSLRMTINSCIAVSTVASASRGVFHASCTLLARIASTATSAKIDANYSCRRCDVAWSVYVCWAQATIRPAKTDEQIEMPLWWTDSRRPKEPCIRGVHIGLAPPGEYDGLIYAAAAAMRAVAAIIVATCCVCDRTSNPLFCVNC